jgi:CarD family transcriptional regulator
VYEVGDKVVYPQHGAGVVLLRESKLVLGREREYLTIRILHSEMTVMVPADGADEAGLRRVIGPAEVEAVLAVLGGEDVAVAGNWSRRFKHNQEKLRSGNIYEVAEVIRNLAGRSREKPLSAGERQLLARAKRILVSEIMYARGIEDAEAEAVLDDALEEIAAGRAASISARS